MTRPTLEWLAAVAVSVGADPDPLALVRVLEALEDVAADPLSQAAALLVGVIRERPLRTGNRALALVATDLAVGWEGLRLDVAAQDGLKVLGAIADGRMDVAQVDDWVRDHAVLRDGGQMFERFTVRARQVMVLAQQEADKLGHPFIGTEHLLLGIVAEGEGVAYRALEELGVRGEQLRAVVGELVPPSTQKRKGGPPPFTPRAKKVLELSLREALTLGHNYIGTEHILLGVIREGDGVGAEALRRTIAGGDPLDAARAKVAEILGAYGPVAGDRSEGGRLSRAWARRTRSGPVGKVAQPESACSFCGKPPSAVQRLVAGPGSVCICDECVELCQQIIAEELGDPEPRCSACRHPLGDDTSVQTLSVAGSSVPVLTCGHCGAVIATLGAA